jgi:hypothetical protein
MQLLEEINETEDNIRKQVNVKKKSKKVKQKKVEEEEIENEESDVDDLNLEDDLYSKEILCKDSSDKLDDFKNGIFSNLQNKY